MKKRTYVTMIIILLLVLTLGIFTFKKKSNNNKDGLTEIKVSEVTRSVFYAPQYVAINKGFFKEKGIEIELTTGQGADAVMTSVLSNQSHNLVMASVIILGVVAGLMYLAVLVLEKAILKSRRFK